MIEVEQIRNGCGVNVKAPEGVPFENVEIIFNDQAGVWISVTAAEKDARGYGKPILLHHGGPDRDSEDGFSMYLVVGR